MGAVCSHSSRYSSHGYVLAEPALNAWRKRSEKPTPVVDREVARAAISSWGFR